MCGIHQRSEERQTHSIVLQNNEHWQTKHFMHHHWKWDISEDSRTKKKYLPRVWASTHVHLHTPQEMMQASAHCAVPSINSWAVNAPAVLFAAIHHVHNPDVPHPASSSLNPRDARDAWCFSLLSILVNKKLSKSISSLKWLQAEANVRLKILFYLKGAESDYSGLHCYTVTSQLWRHTVYADDDLVTVCDRHF